MLQDLSIYDDELRDLEEQVQEYLDSMQKNPRGTTTEWYSRAQDKMKEINKLLHQFNIDVRVLSDSSEKPNYQRKARAHTETVAGLRQALNDMKKKFEQEGMSEGTGDEVDGRVKARKIAKNVTDIQTSALQSLARSEALVGDSERLGVESADTLRQQTEQIKLIGSQLDDLESNLGRARRELNAFTRRMMTDKLILAFIVLIFILLIVGVVLKFVKKAKGPQQQGPQ